MKYSLCLSFILLSNFLPHALAQPWEVGGQVLFTFPDGQSADRIRETNDRLRQIVPNLDPSRSWSITQRPVFITQTEKNTKDPKAKPKTIQKLQSIDLLLNNSLLLTLTEKDVQTGSSLEALANDTANNLNQFFLQPQNRRYLYLVQTVPPQLSYQGKTYKLLTDIIPDRGLFRTTGLQVGGRVIFWEVPANDRTYLLDSKTKQEIIKISQNPDRIFIFDPKLQFIAYSRSENPALK